MNLTNYQENHILDARWRGQSITWPATDYFALICATKGYSSAARSASVTVGDTIIPTTPNGHLYRCSATTGNTGSGEPTWPTTAGGTVTDGGVTWTEMTPDFEAGTNLTEVTGGSYARASLAASLADFAGSQSAGSTTASTGTNGTTSNNVSITYAGPSANWGVIFGVVVYDASSSGNPWDWFPLTTPKTINNGDPAPSFTAGAMTFQIDN